MAAPTNTVDPSFTGTLRVGELLSGANGSWTGSPSFTHQWQVAEIYFDEVGDPYVDELGELWTDEFEDIAGATSINFTPTQSCRSCAVRLKVTGTNVDGSAIAYSAPDGPIIGLASAGGTRTTIAGMMYVSVTFDDSSED